MIKKKEYVYVTKAGKGQIALIKPVQTNVLGMEPVMQDSVYVIVDFMEKIVVRKDVLTIAILMVAAVMALAIVI